MPLNEILTPTNISNTDGVFPEFAPPQIVTLTNGTFALVYGDVADGIDVVWKIFNAQGELLATGTTPEDENNIDNLPDITALSGGGFALTWEDLNFSPELRGEIFTAAYSAQGAVQAAAPSNVTGTAGVSEVFPKVAALQNGAYVVTWQSPVGDTSNSDIYAAIHNSQGVQVSAPVNVSGIDSIHDQRPSVVVLSNSNYVLCWTAVDLGGEFEIYTRVYTAQGVAVSPATNVSVNTEFDDDGVQATALVNGGYALTWHRGVPGGGVEIATAIYNALGEQVVAPLSVGLGQEPRIATLTDGNYALFWNNGLDNFTAVYNAQGQQVLAPVQVSTTPGGDYAWDIAALSNGAYALAWVSEGANFDVFIAVYDAQGQQVAPLNISNSPGLLDATPSITALADGAFAVAWDGEDADGILWGEEFLAIYQFDAPPVAVATNNVVTNEDTASVAVAIGATDADGDVLSYSVKVGSEPAKGSVGFFGDTFVYTPDPDANGADSFTILIDDGEGGTAEQVVAVTINPTLIEIKAPTNISKSDNVFPGANPPQLTTLTNGTFALIYVDGGEGVWRLFDLDGEQIETGKVLADFSLSSWPDIVGLSGGGFVLTWENYIPDTDIYASVYDHEGTPLVDPFDVSDSALTSEFYPWVAALPDDAYALTWQQTVVDINGVSNYDIYTAIYNTLGQEILEPVNVSASAGYDQVPKIAALSNGNYVLTWTGSGLTNPEIYTAVYTAVGEQVVGPTSVATGIDPQTVALANGGYALTWVGSNFQVMTAVYDNQGEEVAAPVAVASSFGFGTRIAALPDGNYALTWNDDVDGWTAVYDALGQPISTPFNFTDTASNPYSVFVAEIVALSNGAYALTWSGQTQAGSVGTSPPTDVFVAVFDAQGQQAIAPVNISNSPGLHDMTPTLTALADGAFAVAWEGMSGVNLGDEFLAIYQFFDEPPPPVITGISPDTGILGDHITEAQSIVVSGTAALDAEEVTVSDGAGHVVQVHTGPGGVWSAPFNALPLGDYDFTATATDASGNISAASSAFHVEIVDLIPPPPVITGISPDTGILGDHITEAQSIVVSGTAALDAEEVTVSDGAGHVVQVHTGPGGVWSAPFNALPLGDYDFTATATDASGNISAASSAFHVEIVDLIPPPPVITGISPDTGILGDHITEAQSIVVSGTAALDAEEVTVSDGAGHVVQVHTGPGGVWSAPFNALPLGDYDFTATATDASGNISAASSAFHVEIVDLIPPPPVITGISPDTGILGDHITEAQSIVVSGTAALDAEEVTVSDGAGHVVQVHTGPGGVWSAPFNALPLGDYDFTATATDASGNISAASSAFHVEIVDLIAPDTTITSGPSGTVSSTSAAFTFSATEAGSTFQASLDGAAFGAVPAGYTGLSQGTHTFEVRAIDAAGNIDQTAASRTWTVDTVAPDTTITSGPSGTVSSTSAAFTFSGTEAGSTFQASLDGAAFGAVPAGYTGLSQGTHTFEVRAIDAAGNIDQTPASRTWTVDTVAPDTTITSGPSGTVSSTSAAFTFSGTEAGSTFQASLDGAAFGAVPAGYTGLSQGTHTFEVRAIDAAGNIDQTAASRTWTVDTVAPDTTITSGPSGTVSSTSAAFTFSGTEAGSTFQASLDGAAFGAVPAGYTGLSQGTHTFEVRAIDAAGNIDQTAASRTWTVDTVAPNTTITSGPSGTVSSTTAAFTFSATEAGSTFQVSLDGGAFTSAGASSSYTDLSQGAHTLQVRAIDSAGNIDLTPASQTWTVDTVANDAPVLDNTKTPAGNAVAEDAGAPSGAVGTLVSSLVDFTGGGGFDNVIDVNADAVTGIAITAADGTNGTWYYSTDNGAKWKLLGSVTEGKALLLAADGDNRVYFRPNANYDGQADIRFRAWDQSSGTDGGTAATTRNGGTTAYSTATDNATFDVTPVNDPALIGGIAIGSVTEDDPLAQTANGQLTISDVDGLDEQAFQAAVITRPGLTLTLSELGAWSVELDSSHPDIQRLDRTVSWTPTVYSVDGTPVDIVITINGVDEPDFNGDEGGVLNGTDADDLIDAQGGNDGIHAGSGNDIVLAGEGDDFVWGESGDDTITGGEGEDTIRGGDGDDTFIATPNDGDDEYNGGAGIDTLDLSAFTSGVEVTLGAKGSQVPTGQDFFSSVENVVGGSGDDNLRGDGADNWIDGGAGDDFLFGSGGLDTLVGGIGDDTLRGGGNNDTFVFASGFGRDTIEDFEDPDRGSQDYLDFTAFGITAADFSERVELTVVGNDMRIVIDDNSQQEIVLLGVSSLNKMGPSDFLLA